MKAALSSPGLFVLEEIEARILYSADTPLAMVAVGLADGWTGTPALVMTHEPDTQSVTEIAATTGEASARSRELAFVDAGLQDIDRLIADLRVMGGPGRDIEIVLLNRETDGVQQISEVLAEREHLDAVHLFTHGTQGAVNLGATRLDLTALLMRAVQIKGWGEALTSQSDIFFYGCDIAGTADGEALIDAVARLTGADVAASTDVTGNVDAGGDWVLEYRVGDTDGSHVLGYAGASSWQGTLNTEFRVNTTTSQPQSTTSTSSGSQKAVAMDASGDYVVVWTSKNQDGSQEGVYARRFDSSGAALTGEILVNQTTLKDQKWVSVASDVTGNFVVTWTSDDDGGDRGDVYIRRFAGNGAALTAEIRVNTTLSNSIQNNSTIGMNAATGEFVVVWQGVGSGDGDGIFFRRYNADGTAKDGAERNANLTDAGNEVNPAIAMAGTGNFVVAWERSNHVYFQRFDSNGVAQGGVGQADNGLATSTDPAVAMNAAGDFTIVYRENVTLSGIWGRGFNADGTQKYLWFWAATGDAADASIDMAADGSFIVTYEKTTDGDGLGVYARKYLTSGAPDGSAFLVNQTVAGGQYDASVALVDTDTSVVVWSGNGPGDSDGVFARAFSTTNLAPTNTVPGAQSTLEDVKITFSSGNGNLISVDDLDVGSANLEVTLTAVNGVLSLSGLTGLSFTVGDGTADATMTFTGSKININAALAGMEFTPTANFSGAASVSIDTNDLGNTGFGGPLSDSDSIAITVSAVNDAPSANADTYTALENQLLTVNAVSGVLSNDSDPENHTLAVLASTTTANGSLSLSTDGSFSYTGNPAFNGADSFRYLLRDTSDGRTHYWGLDTGGTDAIGATNGTVSGAATVAGQFGNALAFDGASNYVTIPDFAYSSAFSVSLWFKTPTNAGSDYGYLYSHGSVGVQTSLNIYLIEDTTPVAGAGKLRTQIRDANDADNQNGLDVDVAALGLADNTWHLYTLTATTGSGTRVFIDGIQRASIANGGDAFDPSGNLIIGGRNDLNATRFFQGAIDGVQIHDHALQAGEIDGILNAPSATVTVNVAANSAPLITSNGGGASAAISMAENSTAVTIVTATDGEAPPQTLTFSLTGADAGLFTLGSSSGVLTFNVAPDRENPLDVGLDNVYEVTVSVTDGILITTQDLDITVTDVNDSAVSAIADLDAGADSVAENAANTTAVGITAHATDADTSSNTVTYSLDDNAGGRFTIDAVSGVVTVAGSGLLDYESLTSHTIIVRATSADTSSSTASFVITLTPVNDNVPVFSSSATPSVAEGNSNVVVLAATDGDLPAQTISYAITGGVDQARFTLAGNQLRFATTTDYEAPVDTDADNVYLVQVTASDGAGGTTTQFLSVTVTDVIEVPVEATPPAIVPQVVGIGVGEDGVPPPTPALPDSTQSVATQSEASLPVSASLAMSAIPAVNEADELTGEGVADIFSPQGQSAGSRRAVIAVNASGLSAGWARPSFMPVAQSETFMPGDGIGAPPGAAVTVEALRTSLGSAQWLGQLQFMREKLDETIRLDGVMIGTTAFVSGSLSVGYVIWLVRGGLLMSTLLSSLPAWQTVDPLPVLGSRNDDDEGVKEDAVESMFERAKKVWRAGKGAGVMPREAGAS